LDTKTTRLEGDEIVARPPFGCRTGEDRNVAAPVIVEILDTPLARAKTILVDRHLPMEGIDRGIDEVIPELTKRHLRWVLGRHDFVERSWPSVAHGHLTLPLHRTFHLGHFVQSHSASLARSRILEPQPVIQPGDGGALPAKNKTPQIAGSCCSAHQTAGDRGGPKLSERAL
jgi:hypothetical protein